jgi:hypothetical protein
MTILELLFSQANMVDILGDNATAPPVAISSMGTEKVITRSSPIQFPWASHGQSIERIVGVARDVWVVVTGVDVADPEDVEGGAVVVDVGSTEEVPEGTVDELVGAKEVGLDWVDWHAKPVNIRIREQNR